MKISSCLVVFISLASLVAAQTTPATMAPARKMQDSAVFDASAYKPEQRPNGQRSAVFDNPTDLLSRFECHVTTLPVGQNSGAAHTHPAVEEATVVQQGTVEVSINNDPKRTVGPGSVIYFASKDLVALRNVGSTPATYVVFSIRVAPPAN
jgi:quercetin dioxygenase-like cupin family protein